MARLGARHFLTFSQMERVFRSQLRILFLTWKRGTGGSISGIGAAVPCRVHEGSYASRQLVALLCVGRFPFPGSYRLSFDVDRVGYSGCVCGFYDSLLTRSRG